ncbi:transposable element Tc1 transposase [Trichonephila clavipes]|nr:transposable element Tc1 transposase [Trichonephila clavipes]
MSNLSDVKRGMVIGARLTGASVTRTINLVGLSRTTAGVECRWTTVSKVMIAYVNLSKVNEGSCKAYEWSVIDEKVSSLKTQERDKITHLQNPVLIKTVQRESHAANIHARVAIPKSLVSALNAMKRLQCCRDNLNWPQMQWEQVI